MKKIAFFYNLLIHGCFQQDEMRKEQIKSVPSLLAFQCLAGKDPRTHTCWAKKIFVDARWAQNCAVAAIAWNAWNAWRKCSQNIAWKKVIALRILQMKQDNMNKQVVKLTWFWWYLLMVSKIMFFLFLFAADCHFLNFSSRCYWSPYSCHNNLLLILILTCLVTIPWNLTISCQYLKRWWKAKLSIQWTRQSKWQIDTTYQLY